MTDVNRRSSKEVSDDLQAVCYDNSALGVPFFPNDVKKHLEGAREDNNLPELVIGGRQLAQEEQALVANHFWAFEKIHKARDAHRRLQKTLLHLIRLGCLMYIIFFLKET